MDAGMTTIQAQLGVNYDGHGHRRSSSTMSNISSATSSNGQNSPEGYGMFNHSLDNQSPSSLGPYRTSRSASIISLDPSESSTGLFRHDRSRKSSISAPYPSRKPSMDLAEQTEVPWSPETALLFQQLQEVQITSQTDSQPSFWAPQGQWAYHHHLDPQENIHQSFVGSAMPPALAVSAPGESIRPTNSVNDPLSRTSIANNGHILYGNGPEEAAADEAREEQLAGLARAVQSANTTSQGDKARSSFVQSWLTSNYLVWPEGNVSRQALYSSYTKVCQRYGVRGINSASFGKAVRAAFPQIKTRRLGVRGNSKYHYCGMRPSNLVEARLLAELTSSDSAPDPSGHAQQPSQGSEESADSGGSPGGPTKRTTNAPPALNLIPPVMIPPDFPSMDEVLHTTSASNLDPDKVREMWSAFTRCAVEMVESFQSAKYEKFEPALRSFYKDSLAKPETRQLLADPPLSCMELRGLASSFNACLGILQDRSLRPVTEGSATLNQFSTLKQIAENIESIVFDSTVTIGSMSTTMVELAARFGHLINRHLGLCQVVQALLGITNSRTAVEELAESWQNMDFEGICNHCALAINCRKERLSGSFLNFGQLLSVPYNFSLIEITQWINQLLASLAAPDQDTTSVDIPPHSILTRSSFVLTQLMRDLTLRSDRSFGTFQLLSLFFQDWIGFSITRQSTLSAQAVTESLCTDSPVAHSPGLSFGSASASEADSTIAQNSSSLLRATHTTGAPLMFSPNTAQLFSECTGNTPQFASFAHGTSFLEDQRTAISTPIASLWKRKEGPTTGATCESAHSNTHCWDSSTVPVVPTSPFISDFFPSFSAPIAADRPTPMDHSSHQ